MDNCTEGATPSATTKIAVCWECGDEKMCREYIVCCTGTVFHVCEECETRISTGSKAIVPDLNRAASG